MKFKTSFHENLSKKSKILNKAFEFPLNKSKHILDKTSFFWQIMLSFD
jgi:hypothetical protein